MSNEVKRWYLYTENEALYAVSKNQRGFVPDASTIEVMRVEDHERIVAEKDREIQHWRGVYMSRPLAKCYEIAQEQIAKQKLVIDELKSHIKLLNSSECQPYDAYYKTCEVHYGLLKEEFDKAKTIIDTQKRVIEKLKGMVSHYETCATVDRYDDEKVPCDCGLEKELAAIEKGEGT